MQILKKTTAIALSLISALAFGNNSADAIHIGVSPPKVEVKIKDKSRSRPKRIKIANFDQKPVRMRAYVRSWTVDENGNLQLIEPDPDQKKPTFDELMIVTPRRFTIAAGGTQTVRFAVRPKESLTPGEYRAMLYIEEIPAEGSVDPQTIRTVGRLGVPIFAYAGEIQKVGVLNSVNVDSQTGGVKAVFDVSSKGNARVEVRGQYAIWPADKYPGAKATQPLKKRRNRRLKLPKNVLHVGRLNSSPVLAGTRRKLVVPIKKKLPPGNYIFDIHGKLGEVLIDKGIAFTVPANTNKPKPKKWPFTSLTK